MKETVTCTCFICDHEFEWGHGAYHTGRKVVPWGEMVCTPCDQRSGTFPKKNLEQKLAAKGVRPLFLENGFIEVPR